MQDYNIKENFSLKLLSTFILLVPFFLIFSIFVADLLVSLTSVIFLFISYKYRLWSYYKSSLVKMLFLFYLYILVRSVFSDINLGTFNSIKIFFYFRFIIFSIALSYIYNSDCRFLKKLTWSLSAIFIFLIFDGFFQFYFKFNIFNFPIGEDGRVSSFFEDELVFGSYLSRFLPLLIGLLILTYKNTKINNLFIFVIFFLTDTVVFISGERAALIVVVISSILMIVLCKNLKIIRISAFVISFFLVFVIAENSYYLKKRIFLIPVEIFQNTINSFFTKEDQKFRFVPNDMEKDIILNSSGMKKRYYFEKDTIYSLLFKTSINIFSQNKIFGQGPKTFLNFCKKKEFLVKGKEIDGCSTHPHNTYFQLLAETGIVGTMFVLSFFLYIFFLLIRHFIFLFSKQRLINDFHLCIYILLFVNMWPFITTGNFFNNWISIIYFYPLGFILKKE